MFSKQGCSEPDLGLWEEWVDWAIGRIAPDTSSRVAILQ